MFVGKFVLFNTNSDQPNKIFWKLSLEKSELEQWFAAMEFEHVDLVNDKSLGIASMGARGVNFAQTSILPPEELGDVPLNQLLNFTVADLARVFAYAQQHALEKQKVPVKTSKSVQKSQTSQGAVSKNKERKKTLA